MPTRTIRLKSAMIASIGSAAFLAAAVAGSARTFSDPVGVKTDRFDVAEQVLCGKQAWPNISAQCVAWHNHKPAQTVRYVTVANTDREAETTILTRMPAE